MTSRYDGVAARWATGASLVYGPLASELVARAPHSLAGRIVLDVGAGTGVGSDALMAVGAVPIALDSSIDMVTLNGADRPPAIVASVEQVPVAPSSVDDIYASFVLNHLDDPVAAMLDLAAATRSRGAFLASVFSKASRSAARDRIDAVAQSFGWEVPSWYAAMKVDVVPLLGGAAAMHAAAEAAGLSRIYVECTAVDVGVDRAEQLVDYRLGQAQIGEWLSSLASEEVHELRAAAIAAVEPVMEPYRPIVVFLSAVVP